MKPTTSFDILIIGAGPAGTCAALRLLDLGYQVGLVEQAVFPRNQIGESLSPGVRNIFQYLRAEHLLYNTEYISGLPANVIWETTDPQYIEAAHHGAGVVVDRSELDQALLNLAKERGLRIWQPAKLESCQRIESKWQAKVRFQNDLHLLTSTVILDARGRKGIQRQMRFQTAPSAVSIWGHVPAEVMPKVTTIEALPDGWLWGSPMPGDRFRTMAFVDPEIVQQSTVQEIFNTLLSQSRLFNRVRSYIDLSFCQTCSVLNYIHTDPWREGYIQLGEAAFTLDPLSSTGVEKAMRFSLQVVIAIHTLLKIGNSDLSKSFYKQKIIEAVATHTIWTKNYYTAAWPGTTFNFWKKRAAYQLEENGQENNLIQELINQSNHVTQRSIKPPQEEIHLPTLMNKIWYQPVTLSPRVSFSESICVVDDLLKIKTAVHHPNFARETAFLGQHELKPLLDKVNGQETFGMVIQKWNGVMAFEDAAKLGAYLWNNEVLLTPHKAVHPHPGKASKTEPY